jgi:curved DNA-binding protein CbpA
MRSSQPDYYRILQVHREAEQEVIDAAYRRLMRKYHPDVLAPSQRESPEAKVKVQEINEAYAVLGDVHKRAEYDAMYQAHQNSPNTENFSAPVHSSVEVEKRIYPGKCAKTKHTFQIHLARRKDSSDVFRVIGFSVVDAKKEGQELSLHQPHQNFLQRLFRGNSQPNAMDNDQSIHNIPSDQELLQMFDDALVLDFGKIDWAGFLCPVCKGVFTHPDGTLASWTICGKCSRISCAGNISKSSFGGIYICPWCGSKRQITYHVPAGTKANKSVRGILKHENISKQQSNNALPDSKDKKRLPPLK